MHSSMSLVLLFINAPWSVLSHPQEPLTQAPSTLDIPSVGLGLWNSEDKDASNAVKYGFKSGYRHLDSAAAYNNEKYVGKGLAGKKSPPREQYWITSKLWNTMHKPENVPTAFSKTLSDLGVDHLDLYLMHWPVAFLPDQNGRSVLDEDTSIEDTWRAMEKLVAKNTTHPERGTTRHIGISNFSPRQIDAILAVCTVCPYAHEFETHPYLQQQAFVNWHADHHIRVIAYSPLANLNPTYKATHPDLPRILDDPFWKGVAEKKGVTVAQAVLGWGVARGTVVIPKSVHKDRIEENLGAGNVTFSNEELDQIAQHDRKARFNNPSKSWGVDLFESLDDGYSRTMEEL